MMPRKFIRHPSDIPIDYNIEGLVENKKEYINDISSGGLSFKSKIELPKNSIINITIPITKPIYKFIARVVWCREQNNQFSIGVEFTDFGDIFKTRMVEQICHIEHYKKEIFEREGRILTGEEAALEWIKKYAAHFPKI